MHIFLVTLGAASIENPSVDMNAAVVVARCGFDLKYIFAKDEDNNVFM